MIKKYFLLLTLVSVTVCNSFAQTFGGSPESFSKSLLTQTIPSIKTPEVDAATLLAEDALNVDKNVPYRFGFNHFVNINAAQHGIWETLSNGDKIWRMKIECPEAFSINISFSNFNIPPSAQLFLYDENKTHIIGAYTSQNVTPDYFLGTDLLPGSVMILEYDEPAFVPFHGELEIYRITHGYRDAFNFAKSYGDAGSCQTNINCPVGANWQVTKKAVVCIVDGGEICTGAMVADVPHSGTPYFLTANHCIQGATVSTWVFRFNWEATGCSNQNGPTNQTVNGCVLRGNKSSSDFALLELNNIPPQSYGVFYAGWNRQNTPDLMSIGIHHPSGDIKKISFDNNPCTSTSWSGTPSNSHWKVDWDGGQCTEPGSSGSPLFDQDHRIIGQLHGGASACGSTDMTDEYGKFWMSWDLGTTNATQLKHWLDPQNTGNLTEDGFDPWAPTDTINLAMQSFNVTGASICLGDTVVPTFTIKNTGINAVTTFNIQYHLDGASNQNYVWNGNLLHNEIATVTLPWFVPVAGGHNYWVHVSTVNGMPSDQEIIDDTLQYSFTVISGMHLQIALTTDNNASQTSMDIKSSIGTIVNSWTGFANNTTYNLYACLDSGCYTFTIYDTGGNGICCTNGNGHFHVIDEAGHVIADGGAFTASSAKQFCLGVPVTSAFTIVDNTLCQGKPITTSNTSINAYSYQWSLTGPTTQTSSNLTFNYTPTLAGSYTLTLIVDNGGSYDTSSQTITVFPVQTLNTTNTQASSSTAADASINLTVVGGTSPFTYHWTTNANGATTQDLNNIAAGVYCVTVTDANNCTKTTCVTVPYFEGLSELYFEAVKIFPNPANTEIEIDLGGIKLNSLILFDETGRRISVIKSETNNHIYFDLKNVASGVYFLQGENEIGIFNRKIVVVHP